MTKLQSLFKDEKGSRHERQHYCWLRDDYFPEPDYFVYPNAALQVIINSESPEVQKELDNRVEWIESLDMMWCPENFFNNSSVDLCVIRKSNYLPFVAFELDDPSHANLGRKEKDEFKDLLFRNAGIPLIRLRVHAGQSYGLKRKHLAEAISKLSERFASRAIGVAEEDQGKRSVVTRATENYFNLLCLSFGEHLVLPNVALKSIFASEEIRRLNKYDERNVCHTGLVDFCVFETADFLPLAAFTMSSDKTKEQVFNHFGLPLRSLQEYAKTSSPD